MLKLLEISLLHGRNYCIVCVIIWTPRIFLISRWSLGEELSADFGRVFSSCSKDFLALSLYSKRWCSVPRQTEDEWNRNLILNSYVGLINMATLKSLSLNIPLIDGKCNHMYGIVEVYLTRNKSSLDSVSPYNCDSLPCFGLRTLS